MSLSLSLENLSSLFLHHNFSLNDTDGLYRYEDTYKTTVLSIINHVAPPLLLVLGTLGNLLTAGVLVRHRFRPISTSIFLLALALADTVYLYFSSFTLIWFDSMFSWSPRLHSDWSCRMIGYIFRSAADISSWLIVAVTIERLLAVCVPFQSKRLCSKPRALTAVITIVAIFLCVNSFTFFTYKVHDTYNGAQHRLCYINEEHGAITTLIIVLYDDMCYSFVPATIICLSNTAILVRLAKQQRSRAARQDGGSSHGESQRLTVMLITISCVFLLSTLPICMVSSYYAITKYMKAPGRLNRPLATLILRFLMNCNHAFNFLLYCLSGPPFREELYKMFHDTACAIRAVVQTSPHTEHSFIHTNMENNGDTIPMMERKKREKQDNSNEAV